MIEQKRAISKSPAATTKKSCVWTLRNGIEEARVKHKRLLKKTNEQSSIRLQYKLVKVSYKNV